MAVVSIPNSSAIKIQYDLGTDLEGKKIYKYKTYGSVQSKTTDNQIGEFVNGLEVLQQNDRKSVTRYDYSSLSE